MKSSRITELHKEIRICEGRIEYINSMISLLMSQANMIDMEIIALTRSGQNAKRDLADFQAELKDTV